MASHEIQNRQEVVALLALLRIAPKGVTWGDISAEVRLNGSAIAVLERMKEAEISLFPNPAFAEAEARAESELTAWEIQNLKIVTVLSECYPSQLAAVFDCPPFLFYRGQLAPLDRGMSVVGSRDASSNGLSLAESAARLLVDRGLTVIAGLASGIDAASHREAIRCGGRTVAVIGTGINRAYPAVNKPLQDEIAEKGLVVSQFYPDQPPTQTTFPMRNATMSGYGVATIIIEAGEYSGSRIQARMAADHGRPVILSSEVASKTSWGAEMAERPWVSVFSSQSELGVVIDNSINDLDRIPSLLDMAPA